MRRILVVFTFFIFVRGLSADVTLMKDGRSLDGQVVEKNDQQVIWLL